METLNLTVPRSCHAINTLNRDVPQARDAAEDDRQRDWIFLGKEFRFETFWQ
jgi:hypothetical protein